MTQSKNNNNNNQGGEIWVMRKDPYLTLLAPYMDVHNRYIG